MTDTMTKQQATIAARQFYNDFVRTDRQWDTDTLASYLLKGETLRSGASYAGPATVSDIAAFMRREAIRTEE